jgi:hypothetical protein
MRHDDLHAVAFNLSLTRTQLPDHSLSICVWGESDCAEICALIPPVGIQSLLRRVRVEGHISTQ